MGMDDVHLLNVTQRCSKPASSICASEERQEVRCRRLQEAKREVQELQINAASKGAKKDPSARDIIIKNKVEVTLTKDEDNMELIMNNSCAQCELAALIEDKVVK